MSSNNNVNIDTTQSSALFNSFVDASTSNATDECLKSALDLTGNTMPMEIIETLNMCLPKRMDILHFIIQHIRPNTFRTSIRTGNKSVSTSLTALVLTLLDINSLPITSSVVCILLTRFCVAKLFTPAARIELIIDCVPQRLVIIDALARGLDYDGVNALINNYGVDLVRSLRLRPISSAKKLLWVWEMCEEDVISRAFAYVVPQLIRLLDATDDSSKRFGIQLLRVSLRKVDLCALREYSPLILETLKRDVMVREEPTQSLILPALVDTLVAVLPRQRPRGRDLIVVVELVLPELEYLALSGTESRAQLARCKIFLHGTCTLLSLLGAQSATQLRSLLPCLFVFVEHSEQSVVDAALTVLERLVQVCWLRMRAHIGKIFESLCRAYVRATAHRHSHSHMVRIIALLRAIDKEKIDALTTECRDIKELQQLFVSSCEHHLDNEKKFSTALQWDMTHIYTSSVAS